MTDEPTCDLDAERAILGAVITEPHYAKQLLDIPREHFYAPAHQDLHTAITTMVLNGDPLDPTTILATTRNHTTPNTRNLHQLVTQLVGTGYGESIPYHARRLHQLHTARTLITTAQTLLHRTTEAIHNNNPEDLATAARTATTALNNTNPETHHTTTYENTLEDWWTDTLQPLDLTNVIPTPWPELNDMLNGGLHPGRSYILAGRPGVGKSVAALNIAGHATENNKHTSLWSLEMPTLEVMSRILANGARAEYSQITKHQLDQHNQNLLAAYTDAYPVLPLTINDRANITIDQITTEAHTRKNTGNLDLAVIDYLQLVTAAQTDTPRQEQVAYISRNIKILAKELKIPTVTACQLNRGPATLNRPPALTDLRESGAIEQDADTVILLHHETDPTGQPTGYITLIIAKNRAGKTGQLQLPWRAYQQRIG